MSANNTAPSLFSAPTQMNVSVTQPLVDGEEITQHWSGVFIFFAFVTSFVAAYAAVRLLDHSLWRSEKEKEHASAVIIRHPQMVAAFLLGFGTVWSMHFIGMAAVTLDRAPMCYDWPITFGSLVSAVVFMYVGVKIADKDVFKGPDRVKHLKEIIAGKKSVTAKGRQKEAERTIHIVAFFYRPWFILGGAVVAATGALIMHYTGMVALKGPFQKRWSIAFVSASVVLGVIVCCAGFWILFRLLHWKVEQFWLRPASAAVIAMAVCCLHFFGMLGVTYVYDESLVGTCGRVSKKTEFDPDAWTNHQVLALAVALAVPSLALLMENLISRELFHAYCKLKNPSLTVEYILNIASRSRDTGIRRASLMAQSTITPRITEGGTSKINPTSDMSVISASDPRRVSLNSVNAGSRRGSCISAISDELPRRSSLMNVNSGGCRRESFCKHCGCNCSFGLGEEKKEIEADSKRGEGGNQKSKRVSFCGDLIADEASSRGDERTGKQEKQGSSCSTGLKEGAPGPAGAQASECSEKARSRDCEVEMRLIEEAASKLEEGRSHRLVEHAAEDDAVHR